jgi:hypothetical protein
MQPSTPTPSPYPLLATRTAPSRGRGRGRGRRRPPPPVVGHVDHVRMRDTVVRLHPSRECEACYEWLGHFDLLKDEPPAGQSRQERLESALNAVTEKDQEIEVLRWQVEVLRWQLDEVQKELKEEKVSLRRM